MNRCWKILIAAGTTLGMGIFGSVIHHYQLRAATDAYIAELKAKGEPMDLAQVIPPPVPPEQNAAPLITNALSQIYLESDYTNSIIFKNWPVGMNQEIPGKEMIGWHQPFIHDPEGNGGSPTNTWEDLATQLAGRQKDLNDFRKLIENPILDFNLDYSADQTVFDMNLMSHLSQLKGAIPWLEVSEYYNLHQGKTADACTDVRAMLAFVKSETDARFEISQVIRFFFAGASADSTWDILQTTNVSDEDLAQLQQDWQSLEFITPLRNAFLFERVSEFQLVNQIRNSPTNFLQEFGSAFLAKGYRYEQTGEGTSARWVLVDQSSFPPKMMNKISIPWDETQWQWFWSYTDEVRGLRMWQVVIEGTEMLKTNNSFQSVQSFLNMNFVRLGFDSVKNNPYAIISQNAHGQIGAIDRLARAEVVRNIVITAIALKRYELRHHQLPATLAELTPDLLKSVPIDYMDGQPLRYRRNVDGTFLLYSVGENGKDDGGNPSLKLEPWEASDYYWQNPKALDWVWRQPATEEEIQAYYKKISSPTN